MITTGLIKSANIVHFCKDCRAIVDVKQVGKKYVYTCKKCGTKNVAFGTEKSIKDFYHVKENVEGESGKPEIGKPKTEKK